MNDEETIIDLKFGLSQLSGNQDLLVKLLTKFHAQYADLPETLDTLIDDGEVSKVVDIIHTVKGVSGNLGLNALHLAARYLESMLSNKSDKNAQIVSLERRTALAEFTSVLTKTSAEIALLSQQNSPIKTVQKNNLNELKDLLLRNEYIPQDKLNHYLGQSNLDESQKNHISQAIEELDYPKALTLLESN